MPQIRRKVSAVANDFRAELGRLERFDSENQSRFSGSSRTLSKPQLWFLTEAVFFRAFRAYDGFIRDIFLLYCLEKRPLSGFPVKSFLKPRNFLHAERLLQSTRPFLDWANPDMVIERAETYLADGFPIKLPYSSNRETLSDMRYVRNHIAHESKESLSAYVRVLIRHYGTVPLTTPSPGEFLLEIDAADPNKYKLQVFFDVMRRLSFDLT